MDNLKDPIKIFIKQNSPVVITCPRCNYKKKIPAAQLKHLKKTVQVHCTCDEYFYVTFESIRISEKMTTLKGQCVNLTQHNRRDNITIKNITRATIEFTTVGQHEIQRGNKLQIEFKTTTPRSPKIQKKAIVRIVHGKYISCNFLDGSGFDRELDEFLMA